MIKNRPRHLPGLLLTGLLHVAIFVMFMHGQRHADDPRADRDAIQWLLPLASPTPPIPRSPPRLVSRPRPPPPEMKNLPSVDFFAAPAKPSAKPADSAPAPAQPSAADDPFAKAEPAPARPRTADDIMRQAKLDVRAIDAELRKAYPDKGIPPPLDTKQARLERGINAAHDAVGPKWYQPARIVEVSPKDARTRTYKIITAVGAYCITVAEDGKKSYTLCP